MFRIIGAALVAVGILLAGASGAAIWALQQGYNQVQANFVNAINQNAPTLSASCHSELDWPQAQRIEQCVLRLQGEKVLELSQQIELRPWTLSAKFRLTPIYQGRLMTAQQGQWQLPLGAKELKFSAQAQGDFHSRRLNLAPWAVTGWVSLADRQSAHFAIHIQQGRLHLNGTELELKGLNLAFDLEQIQQQPRVRRVQLKLDEANIQSGQFQSQVRGVQMQNANLYDERLSMLFELSLQGAKFSSYSQELRLEPTELSLYIDELHLDSRELWQGLAAAQNQDSLALLWQRLQLQLAQGSKITMENFHTDLMYQIRQGGLSGTSGDIKLSGSFEQRPRALPTLKLNLDLNSSLMLGPQAELMLSFLETGWLYQRQERLTSHVLYRNGKLLANGQLVSMRPLWPTRYVEDH